MSVTLLDRKMTANKFDSYITCEANVAKLSGFLGAGVDVDNLIDSQVDCDNRVRAMAAKEAHITARNCARAATPSATGQCEGQRARQRIFKSLISVSNSPPSTTLAMYP